MYNPKITINDLFPQIPITKEESKAMTNLIASEITIIESEELLKAVASELLIPDPGEPVAIGFYSTNTEEVSEANNETAKGS